MSQRYTGLPPALKKAVFERDNHRCRWCGRTTCWRGFDVHHIQYRRGYAYDVLENLITLCRDHHDLVHDSYRIPKTRAQEVLTFLISPAGLGTVGMAVVRRSGAHRPGPVIEKERSSEIRIGRLL